MAHPCRASFGSLPLASLSATSLASPLFETPDLSFEGRVRNVASYSTDLDRPRQTSTELDAQAHGVRLDRLDRQGLDSTSTAPRRSLDSSTARQPGLNASSARSSHGRPRNDRATSARRGRRRRARRRVRLVRVCAGTNVRAVRGLWLNSQLSVKYKFQRERRRPGAGVRLKR